MKRILMSLFTIASVAALSIGATGALFSDTVTLTGNTLSTGILDIIVNDKTENVQQGIALTDMKPGYIKYNNFTVDNVSGSNPANITKRIVVTSDSANLRSQLLYGLSVEIKKDGVFYWKQTIFDYDKTISEINGTEVLLGMLPADIAGTSPVDYKMYVTESYKMKETAGDVYQGKTMTYEIIVKGEQLSGNMVLENKTGEPKWDVIQDGISGTLTYGVMDATFKGSFAATGLASGDYKLIKYVDPWPGTGSVLLGMGTVAGGNLTINFDVPSNSFSNAKIWLVKAEDFNGTQMTGWNPTSYLFETALIDYIKS